MNLWRETLPTVGYALLACLIWLAYVYACLQHWSPLAWLF